MRTLWNNQAGYEEAYLHKYPGYYLTGDGGYKDKDGYFYVMGRIDDVINVAGHRLSTGAIEEVVSSHPAVAECAVLGIADEYRGQIPVGLVVIKDGVSQSSAEIQEQMTALVRNQIGALACYKTTLIVKRLPKTRSGKILRKTLRLMMDGSAYTLPSTIDDPSILSELEEDFRENKVGIAFSKGKETP
jgi:propionyl-CoA synthetase